MAQVPSKTPAQNQDLNSNLDPGLDLSQSQGAAAGVKMSDLSPTSNLPSSELSQSDILQGPKLVYPVQVLVDDHVYRQQQWQQGRWGKMPIKSKVMAIAALLGFLPTLTLGFINYTFQSDALARQLEQEALQSGSAINDQLSLFMRERFGDIQIIAQANVLSDAATRAGSSTQAKADVLNQFLKAYPVYNNIAAFDLNGEPIAKSDGEALGNHADRAYFQDAKQSGRVVISQPIVSKSTGEVSVYVASPIRDNATQAMVGIARARISIAYFNELLGDVASTAAKDKGGSIQYDLYNAAGERFASSRAGGTKAQTLPKVSQMQGAATLDRLRNRKVVDQSQQTGQAVAETTPESVLALVPFRTYSDGFRGELPPLQWKNLTTIDRSVLQDEQNRLALGLLVQALLAGGILTVAGALLATRATQPLLAAVKAVQEIGRGKWDVRLPVNGEDELATLASTLNQMAQQLESLNTEQKNTVLRAGWLSTITNGAEAMTDVELDESFSQVMAETRRLLGGDRVLLYRIDAQGQLAVAQESVLADLPAAIHLDLTETTLPESFIHVFQQNQPMAIADALSETLPRPYAQLLETLQVRSELVVPLVENHQLSGLLVAQSCEPRFWQESEQTFLQQLAGQIGIAKLIQEVQTARGTAESNAQREKERTEELQRRVLQLLMEVDPVSQGDLTIRAKVTEDEIGTVADSYNATIESLRKIVGQVKDAVQQVSSTALTSETAVQELSDGANRQTAEIADALAKIQLMTTSIRMVATNAMQAEAAVQQAAQTVQAGDAAMNKTVEGIFGIRETVGEAAKKVKRLGESSQKISKVVNLIGSFAEQTNLLALNASIEAAHAGEEGRGFAVVADEVRSLARQSAAATAEIEALVAEIQAETNQVSAAMESGTEQVVAGTQLVENARQNLNQIAAVSEQISELVEAIAQATHQQTEVSDLVSQVMTNVSDIAQQTSGSATAVSSSFQDLVNVAQSLQESVGQFKVR